MTGGQNIKKALACLLLRDFKSPKELPADRITALVSTASRRQRCCA